MHRSSTRIKTINAPAIPCWTDSERNDLQKRDAMLQKGIIEPAQSKWSSPVMLVPNPDRSWRFCIDYRLLNAITIRDTYLVSKINDCVESLGEPSLFSTVDKNSGSWQVSIAKDNRDKTMFTCQSGPYRIRCIPSGLINAPAGFQRTLDILLRKFN